jgi:hypothetical protein
MKLLGRARFFVAAGFVLGLLFFVGLRVALIKDNATHYHANFALYVNGQRNMFDNFTFYEEVQSCSVASDPKHRVHMHGHVNHVVHVHDEGVTWGAFFANLGYGLTDKTLGTNNGVFVDGQDGNELRFYLNGQEVGTVANTLIDDEDVLLVDYGDQGKDLKPAYEQIKKDAGEYNKRQDPASCAGQESLGFGTRIKRALDFTK